jgi:acyl-CoA thioesterase YciA
MSRVTTVAIDAMEFLHPVAVGDTLSCYASLVRIGRTSMKISVEVWVHHFLTNTQERVTTGLFTYVAIDGTGKPQPVKR